MPGHHHAGPFSGGSSPQSGDLFFAYQAVPAGHGEAKIGTPVGPLSGDPVLPAPSGGHELLHAGSTFSFAGITYTYVGGADLGGLEIGFFGETADGHVVIFTPESIPSHHSGNITLNPFQDWVVICFMAGTAISTPSGSARVEDLAIGDLVLTADGKTAPVRWIGRQTVSTVFADPNRVMPIRIRAGALGEALPARDLLVSPCHAIGVDDVLVQAGALVNGSTIVRETNVPTTFVYYHVELDDHSLILAEGVPAETFVDNIDRMGFDNWDEHLALYPEGRTVQELSYPRAASARQVPAAIVQKLSARASEVVGPLRQAA